MYMQMHTLPPLHEGLFWESSRFGSLLQVSFAAVLRNSSQGRFPFYYKYFLEFLAQVALVITIIIICV